MEDKKIETLSIEELEGVSGGRYVLRESEKKDWIRVREKLEEKARSLRHAGRTREASVIETAYAEAYDEWVDLIKMAPENGPDILFSDYFLPFSPQAWHVSFHPSCTGTYTPPGKEKYHYPKICNNHSRSPLDLFRENRIPGSEYRCSLCCPVSF